MSGTSLSEKGKNKKQKKQKQLIRKQSGEWVDDWEGVLPLDGIPRF